MSFDLLESSTEGIEIIQSTFKTALRCQTGWTPRELLERNFRINIWDFGGQEVYHATHQFFLTRRSLYVLVADDRKEDTDFNYWLQVVELRSDGSPFLIVQNEKQDRRRDINLGSLRARFPNLKDAYRVNLADNRGLEQDNRGDQAGIGTFAPYRYAASSDMEPCAGCVGKGQTKLHWRGRIPGNLRATRLHASRRQAVTKRLPARPGNLLALSGRSCAEADTDSKARVGH